jgi:lipoxygenase homology domain-containing protein 1
VTIIPKSKSKSARNSWYLEKVELVKRTKHNEPQTIHLFGLNDKISHETNYFRDISIIKGSRSLIESTTYTITTKTSDMNGASSDANVFIVLSGTNALNIRQQLDRLLISIEFSSCMSRS